MSQPPKTVLVAVNEQIWPCWWFYLFPLMGLLTGLLPLCTNTNLLEVCSKQK